MIDFPIQPKTEPVKPEMPVEVPAETVVEVPAGAPLQQQPLP